MLESFSVDVLLIAGRAIFLVFSFILAAIAFNRLRRTSRAEAERTLSQVHLVLERLSSVQAGLTSTNARLDDIAARIESPAPATAPSSTHSPSYQIAIRLARGGASREELVESCGLSRQEAELVRRLHGPAVRRPALAEAAAN